jgi:F-type H+-transporting ATPase subunit gamma
LERGRNFGHPAIDMMMKTDTYMQRKAPMESPEPSMLLVPITTDRGLCGGINSGIVRELKSFILNEDRTKMRINVIGEKGVSALLRPFPDMVTNSYSGVSHLNFPTSMVIAEQISKNSEGYDKIVIIYNQYITAITTEIKKMELMPRKRFLECMKYQKLYNQTRPDSSTSNTSLYDLYLSANFNTAYLNNIASE